MRQINEIHLHHAASDLGDLARVFVWHTDKHGNSWRDIGYHFMVERDGTVRLGRPLGAIPASIPSRNQNAIAVCVGIDGRKVTDPTGHAWFKPLVVLLADLVRQYGVPIIEHREGQPVRDCPGWSTSVTKVILDAVQAYNDDHSKKVEAARRVLRRHATK